VYGKARPIASIIKSTGISYFSNNKNVKSFMTTRVVKKCIDSDVIQFVTFVVWLQESEI
jgi:hypothetical protein